MATGLLSSLPARADLNGLQKALQLLLLGTCGAGVAMVAWGYPSAMWMLLLLPLLWSASPTRAGAFLVILSYGLAGSWEIVPGYSSFYGGDRMLSGALIWLACNAAVAAVWGIFWVPRGAARAAVLAMTALVISIFPPAGIMGWNSPLLVASWLAPGAGWAGLAATMLYIGLAAALPRLALPARLPACIAFGLTLLLAGLQPSPDVKQLPGWVGIDTVLDPPPSNYAESATRKSDLTLLLRRALDKGAHVVVMPEGIAGVWDPAVQAVWRADIPTLLAQKSATVLVGAQLSERSGDLINAVLQLNPETLSVYPARQPAPLTMWRPFAFGPNTWRADWSTSGLDVVQGHAVMISVCYETVVPFLTLKSFAQGAPEAIVTVANVWWANPSLIRMQRKNIESWARIFGVPLYMAVNT